MMCLKGRQGVCVEWEQGGREGGREGDEEGGRRGGRAACGGGVALAEMEKEDAGVCVVWVVEACA